MNLPGLFLHCFIQFSFQLSYHKHDHIMQIFFFDSAGWISSIEGNAGFAYWIIRASHVTEIVLNIIDLYIIIQFDCRTGLSP